MCFLPVHGEIADSVSGLMSYCLNSTDIKCPAAHWVTLLMCTVWAQTSLGTAKMITVIILIWSRSLSLPPRAVSSTAYLQGWKKYLSSCTVLCYCTCRMRTERHRKLLLSPLIRMAVFFYHSFYCVMIYHRFIENDLVFIFFFKSLNGYGNAHLIQFY